MNPFSFPAIGVDISDESFKFLRLEYRKKRRQIAFFGDRDLPKGVVESGEIKDVKALAAALRGAFAEYRRKFPYLILSLPEEKGFLRLIKLQKIPHAEIAQALEFQLEEHIPYPPSELVFDFHVLPQGRREQGEINIVVMAYPKELVASYMAAVEQAGFTPIVFELESQAAARAVVPRGTTSAVLVGDIGRTRTTFAIVYRGSVHFTSTIGVGGRDIDAILRDSLHVTEEQARAIKIGRGLDVNAGEIIKSLSPALIVLKDEADRQIRFWSRRREENEPAITDVYLCGGDAHLKGLPESLERDLGVTVSRARVWENIFDLSRYVPPMSAHLTLRYATAIGLAMRGDDDLFKEKT